MPRSDGFFIEPVDALWTRTGRPFTAGESEDGGGVFPPTPWTWQGMIRTRVLVAALGPALTDGTPAGEVARLVGPPDRLPDGWRIRGPLPARAVHVTREGRRERVVEPWVPWPAFLSAARPDGAAPVRARRQEIDDLAGSSSPWASPEPEALPPGETFAESGWISARNLLWALLGRGRWDPAGATPPLQKRAQGGSDLPPFVAEERRAGVAIDDETRRALDHMLYTSTRHRFAPDTGLWGALEGAPASAVDALGEGPASLGRRQGQVTLGALPAIDGWSELIDGTHLRGAVGRHLRVVLLTPAEVPPRGSWPFPVPRGAEVRGAIARAGRPIGGFEQGKGGRPTRTTWAAGSTWWVELTREIADVDLARAARDLLLPLHDHERFGFALRAVAPFDPLTGTPELPHA